jgi:DNA-binding XRE family transcriptional regulator
MDAVESMMRGAELAAWRKRLGYSQLELMLELDVKSRQTISSWENAADIPRVVELALHGLEHHPPCRRRGGKKVSVRESREYLAKMSRRETVDE